MADCLLKFLAQALSQGLRFWKTVELCIMMPDWWMIFIEFDKIWNVKGVNPTNFSFPSYIFLISSESPSGFASGLVLMNRIVLEVWYTIIPRYAFSGRVQMSFFVREFFRLKYDRSNYSSEIIPGEHWNFQFEMLESEVKLSLRG